MSKKTFASDNYSGVCPEVMAALNEVNEGHVSSYGNDQYTKDATALIQKELATDAKIFFVFNGTAANVLSIKAAIRSYNSVICPSTSHLNVNETGAPEAISGSKLILIPSKAGKITVEQIKNALNTELSNGVHSPKPKLVSISQSTEYGTVYTNEEIKKISDFCHQNNLYLHVDGCRIYNAAVTLGCDFKQVTTELAIDVMSLGGTKNGLMYGEAIVFFNKHLAEEFEYQHKQGLQLASKMRYIAAQFKALFTNKLWYKNASQANKMTTLLAEKLKQFSQLTITQAVQTNHIFVTVPKDIIPQLQEASPFYVWDEATHEVRLVTSFDTTQEDIDLFISTLTKLLS